MSISGYAEIIENNMVKPEDIPKFAGRIHSEASRLSSLVEDIIKLSRLDENDQSIPMEEVDLMQICRDVEGHLSIRAKEQQVKMTLRGESCRIKGAQQVLYEMIYNLCDNAIKYNRRDGEVEVTVSRGRNGRQWYLWQIPELELQRKIRSGSLNGSIVWIRVIPAKREVPDLDFPL